MPCACCTLKPTRVGVANSTGSIRTSRTVPRPMACGRAHSAEGLADCPAVTWHDWAVGMMILKQRPWRLL
ncbi:hypothetical protein WJX74_002586 [Apatococcus lobatus]|uniref:Uncharacterized protein n=1 Tax=Apatococcus lobatus TaxID=904363 RepID=A0AAW1SB75_9CHLO